MKQFFLKLWLIALLFIVPFSAFAQDTYIIDPSHTYVLWHISHFGYSNPSGKWYASGSLVLDQAKPQNSKVNVTIKLADIVTGIPKLDEHLKSATFFDIAKFPTATFVSTSIDVTGKNTAKVYGNLNLHGITKPLILYVTLNKMGVSPITNKMTVGFSATTQLERSDYGISEYLPGLGDIVKIEIEVEASKA